MPISQGRKKSIFLFLSIVSTAFIFIMIPFARNLASFFIGLHENNLFYPFMILSFLIIWFFIYQLIKDQLVIRSSGLVISFIGIALLLYLLFSIPILVVKIHLLLYGILSLFMFFYFMFLFDKYFSLILTCGICFNIAVADELIQYFVPRRVGDYKDIIFDAFASILSIMIFYSLLKDSESNIGKRPILLCLMLYLLFFISFFLFVDTIHGFGYRHRDEYQDMDITFYSTFRRKDLIEYDREFGNYYESKIKGMLHYDFSAYIESWSLKETPYLYELLNRIHRFIYFRNKIRYEEHTKKQLERLDIMYRGERYILETYFSEGIKPLEHLIVENNMKQLSSVAGRYNSKILDYVFYHFSRSFLIYLLIFLYIAISAVTSCYYIRA